jgi:hypothetical protein
VELIYISLFKLWGIIKFIIVFGTALIVGVIALLSGVPHEHVSKYISDHVEYFTCSTTAIGTVLATKTYTISWTSGWNFFVHLWIIIIQVSVTVTLTFFLTKFLKNTFPDKVKNIIADKED